MCDMDFGDNGGMDIGMDVGTSEDLVGYERMDDLCESITFDGMSDISGVDEAEEMDMDIEEYPSLSEFDGVEQSQEKHGSFETYDYETAPETLGAVNPEFCGEYAFTENIYEERWRKFAEEFSDSSESDGWDSLSDVPFSGEE